MKWMVHVVGMEVQRNAYKMLYENLMRRECLEETDMVVKATSQRILKSVL
jgi:hypothetical protein